MADDTSHLPIELRPPEGLLVFTLMFPAFFGVVALVLGAAGGWWPMCLVGAVLFGASVLILWHQKRCKIVLEAERLTVCSPFSQETILYQEADLLLLRRSWSQARGGTMGRGLRDVAVQFQKGKKILATIPVSWREAKGFREAMAFLETLPIQKKYL